MDWGISLNSFRPFRPFGNSQRVSRVEKRAASATSRSSGAKARAEYRLRLRANNASTRLTPLALAAGCVGAERAEWFAGREDQRATGRIVDPALADEVEEEARYAPYLARQDAELRDLRAGEALPLDDRLDFAAIPGLSREMAERLGAARPATLGAAGRVPGITPAALAVLLVHARQRLAA
jgi:tRNA uridine 5-carboxymethylaminomethyl modification enzyme